MPILVGWPIDFIVLLAVHDAFDRGGDFPVGLVVRVRLSHVQLLSIFEEVGLYLALDG